VPTLLGLESDTVFRGERKTHLGTPFANTHSVGPDLRTNQGESLELLNDDVTPLEDEASDQSPLTTEHNAQSDDMTMQVEDQDWDLFTSAAATSEQFLRSKFNWVNLHDGRWVLRFGPKFDLAIRKVVPAPEIGKRCVSINTVNYRTAHNPHPVTHSGDKFEVYKIQQILSPRRFLHKANITQCMSKPLETVSQAIASADEYLTDQVSKNEDYRRWYSTSLKFGGWKGDLVSKSQASYLRRLGIRRFMEDAEVEKMSKAAAGRAIVLLAYGRGRDLVQKRKRQLQVTKAKENEKRFESLPLGPLNDPAS
jgi:hypothetical protein